MGEKVRTQQYQFGEYEDDEPSLPLFTLLAGTKHSGILRSESAIPSTKAMQTFARAVAAKEKLRLLPQTYIGVKTEYVDGSEVVNTWKAGEASDIWGIFVQAFKNARSRS